MANQSKGADVDANNINNKLKSDCMTVAQSLMDDGQLVIPVTDKKPLMKNWNKTYRPTLQDLSDDYDRYRCNGIGVVHGTPSGNLYTLDFESMDIYRRFYREAKPLVSGRVTPLLISSGKGVHFSFRTNEPLTDKLRPTLAKTADGSIAIELLGERCNGVRPPSRHPNGHHYHLRSGDLANPPKITTSAAEKLLAICRGLNEYAEPDRKTVTKPMPDIFASDNSNATGDYSTAERLRKRATEYLAKCEPAATGSKGDERTFRIAGHLLSIDENGHRLSVDEVTDIMSNSAWNASCSPPWDARDLRGKVDSAGKNGTPPAVKPANRNAAPDYSDADGDTLDLSKPTNDALTDDDDHSDLIMADTVKARAMRWLWRNRIPTGNTSIIYGYGDNGKSTLTASMVGTVTTGRDWCDGESCEMGGAIVISGEENVAETVIPKLTAAGADLSRIGILKMVTKRDKNGKEYKKAFNYEDLKNLERELKRMQRQGLNPKLVIIDPIGSMLADKNTNQGGCVRALLMTPLQNLAEEMGVAIVMVGHSPKGRGKANQKLLGSIEFYNAARFAYYVAPHPTGDGKVFACEKANGVRERPPTLAYSFESADYIGDEGDLIEVGRIKWTGTVDVTADEAQAADDEPVTKTDEAKDLLDELLGNGKTLLADGIKKLARSRGISERTLMRAKQSLGVQDRASGFQGKREWFMLDVHAPTEHEHREDDWT